ncbi:putative RNA-directed DNA polymerase [Helianthus annuus]|nr:putative RNA-directed DNA polymerase [Helianthus annuus]
MHLRNFGCLCFSTVLNESDKFTYHADKCVLIGYSNVKKGYKLWSLDNKKVLFSRDVKFYEDVYPFKNKHVGNSDFIDKTLNHITFFDCYDTETPEVSQMPDDEEGNNGSHGSSSDDQQPLGPSTSTITSIADQPQQVPTGYEGSSETGFYGEAEDSGTPSDETNLSEGADSLKLFQRCICCSNCIFDFSGVLPCLLRNCCCHVTQSLAYLVDADIIKNNPAK